MGKGTIQSYIGDGEYSVQINYYRERYNKWIELLDYRIQYYEDEIAELNNRISTKQSEIAAMEPGPALDAAVNELAGMNSYKTFLTLTKVGYEKKKEFIEDNMPEDFNVNAFCADLTEDLSGEVGTIEIAGEFQHGINIQPGYEENAVYNSNRDGQMEPAVSGTASGNVFNMMVMPGWQKWKPNFRYGQILALDEDNDIAQIVELESVYSGWNGESVDQDYTLTNVPIEYMSCDAKAFEVGDMVLVEFENQDFSQPKIIGFKESPRSCILWEEPWGETITENHPWVELGDFYGEINPEGIFHISHTASESEVSQIKWNSMLRGGTEDPIEGAEKMFFKISAGIQNKDGTAYIGWAFYFYDEDDNLIAPGGISQFFVFDIGTQGESWLTNPGYLDFRAYGDDGEYEIDLTALEYYGVKIGGIDQLVLLDENNQLIENWDYLYFM